MAVPVEAVANVKVLAPVDVIVTHLIGKKDKEANEDKAKDKKGKDVCRVRVGAGPEAFGFPNKPEFGCGLFTGDR